MPRHEAVLQTTYKYTLASGQTILLQEGVNGINSDVIAALKDLDRIEDNEARRDREHRCYLTEFTKSAIHDDGNAHTDPIDNIADMRWAPEAVLFSKESQPSLMDRVEAILPRLTSAQQELFRLLRLGLTESQLATHLGISRDAVKSRRRYLRAAIRRQLGGTDS